MGVNLPFYIFWIFLIKYILLDIVVQQIQAINNEPLIYNCINLSAEKQIYIKISAHFNSYYIKYIFSDDINYLQTHQYSSEDLLTEVPTGCEPKINTNENFDECYYTLYKPTNNLQLSQNGNYVAIQVFVNGIVDIEFINNKEKKEDIKTDAKINEDIKTDVKINKDIKTDVKINENIKTDEKINEDIKTNEKIEINEDIETNKKIEENKGYYKIAITILLVLFVVVVALFIGGFFYYRYKKNKDGQIIQSNSGFTIKKNNNNNAVINNKVPSINEKFTNNNMTCNNHNIDNNIDYNNNSKDDQKNIKSNNNANIGYA